MYSHYATEATKWTIGPMPIDDFLNTFLPAFNPSKEEIITKSVPVPSDCFENVPGTGRNINQSLVCNKVNFCAELRFNS